MSGVWAYLVYCLLAGHGAGEREIRQQQLRGKRSRAQGRLTVSTAAAASNPLAFSRACHKQNVVLMFPVVFL